MQHESKLSTEDVPVTTDEKPDAELEIELSSLYHPNSPYTVEQKLQAAMTYLTTGSVWAVHKATGIPKNTISDWKTRSSWWPDIIAQCKKVKQDELDAMFTEVIHLGIGETRDRIINGDPIYDSKTGEIKRVPMKGKDVATTAAILYDKRAVLRGDPTSIQKKESTEDTLKLLAKKFEQFSKDMKNPPVIEVIDASDETEL